MEVGGQEVKLNGDILSRQKMANNKLWNATLYVISSVVVLVSSVRV